MELNELIDSDLLNRYEFVNYGHALEILTTAFTSEWVDILACLKNFKITKADLLASGGNESPIPKKLMNYYIQKVGKKFVSKAI